MGTPKMVRVILGNPHTHIRSTEVHLKDAKVLASTLRHETYEPESKLLGVDS